MKTANKPWINLILAPIWFLIIIVVASIYFGSRGVNEQNTAIKIAENTPLLILIVQILILATLLYTTWKDNFNIFKNGWSIERKNLTTSIFGGIATGIFITALYIFILSPLQYYLQLQIGDYIPAGETMNALGKQTVLFFIANVILAPFVEESLYRNYALTKFSEKYGQPKSITITVIMFGLLHWLGGIWYIILTGLAVGLPFALIAIKKKNIVWVFVAHLTLNILEFIYITTKS